MRIGRYEIKVGRTCWVQTRAPTTVRRFLFFVWVFEEAGPQDVDSSLQFPLDTRPENEGRVYRYARAVPPGEEQKVIKGGKHS